MGAKKVLILEDDSTLANALAGAVKKAGYESVICHLPDEALKELDKNSFKVVFIDCLLPQTPGVEVAKSIRKNFDSKILPIVMMSGIFTDKQMMRDITQEISALDFLKKPFEVNEVLKFLEKESVASKDETLAKSIFSLPDRLGADPTQRYEILKTIKSIHGFELPLLFTSMVSNSCSGIMEFSDEKGVINKISFYKGNIVGVESTDRQSFLGKLLVSNGWVLPEDLELELKRPSEKKLGQRLVEENLISPHAVFDVMEKQMAFRLEQMIQNKKYFFNFSQNIIENNDSSSIEVSDFYLLLDQWISKIIPSDWLNNQINAWSGYLIEFGPSHDPYRNEYEVPCIQRMESIIRSVETNKDLSVLQNSYKIQISDFNKAFYYMLCLRFLLFSEKIHGMSDQEKIARIQKLWSQVKDLNLIETFLKIGGRREMNPDEVIKLKTEFIKKFLSGLTKFESKSPQEMDYKSLSEKINMVFDLFIDPKKVLNYERLQESGHASKRTQAQLKMEEAKKLLSLGQYKVAMGLINKAVEIYPSIDSVDLYQVWAKIGALVPSKNWEKEIIDIDQKLTKISKEEKSTSIGYFVQGLVAKKRNDLLSARTHFEKAIAADKGFIEARRELNKLPPVENKKNTDILHGDLSTVIGNFFKKS